MGDIVAVPRHSTEDFEPIPGFLARVRARLYRHEARRAALYATALVAGIALIVPLAGHLASGNRVTALAVLGAAGLAGAIVLVGAIVLGVVAPRRRWGGDPEVARWVGTRKRDVASDLLSAVELATAPARPGAPSRALVDALIAATSARIEDVNPAELLPQDELRRARRWALVAVVANGLLLAASPRLVRDGWRGLVSAPPAPFDGARASEVPLVGDLEVRLEFPAYSRRPALTLESSSGDVRGLPGTAVTLRARTLVPAREVELVIEPPVGGAAPYGGKGGLGGPGGKGGPSGPGGPGGPGGPSGQGGKGGKGGQGGKDGTGGTDDAQRRIQVQLDGDQITAKLTLDRPARYRFAITSPSGDRSIESASRALEVEPDQAPAVQLLAPAEPLDVTNLRRVELAYVIEDDFGISAAELVWEAGKDKGKKAIVLDPAHGHGSRAQGKVLWDIAEVQVPSGGSVRYWLEAKDNDSVDGANVGKSRELHLKVTSPRERHEETLGRHQELAEKVLKQLGGRITMPPDDAAAREEAGRALREVIVELGSLGGAYEKDPHASDAMRKALAQMRDRLDRLAMLEQKLVPKGKTALKGAYTATDAKLVGELEDDTIILADWLDRERLEGVMDVSDEIAAHQKRLADLLAQYQQTKDPRLLEEIEREMKALDRSFAELEKHRRGMPEDVLDQYVNRDAVQAAESTNCLDEVRRLVRAGQLQQAQQKLEACRAQHDRNASNLEGSLAALRGDKFSDEQRKLDEVMNELSDLAKDQDDIAAEANRIFEDYADKADEVAKEHRREASKKVAVLVDKLRRRLKDMDESGLTPFAKEELDIVERRLADVESMVSDGDLAEATGMARQAKQSLDTMAGELEAALEDDPKSKWADATQDALDAVGKARPIAKDLIDELQALLPRPEQIMSPQDLRALDRLRRRQAMNRDRTKRLSERTKQLGGDLPGNTGAELGKKLGGAIKHMESSDERARAKDPSGTREGTRSAADALAKARDRARSAARQAQEGAVADEPIRIPGADEYRAPERFREDLLEAMKKKGQQGPDGYDDQIKRYYEELIK
jgi:hypothetical protein